MTLVRTQHIFIAAVSAAAFLLASGSNAAEHGRSGISTEIAGTPYPGTVYFTVKRYQDTLLESVTDFNESKCVNNAGGWTVPTYTRKGYTEVESQTSPGTGTCSGTVVEQRQGFASRGPKAARERKV